MTSKMKITQSNINAVTIMIFFLIVVLLGGSIFYMRLSIKSEQTVEERRTEFKQLGINLADASDYLTDEARKFAVTRDIIHLNKYWQEINKTKTRDNVILRLNELNAPEDELELLAEAKNKSDSLVNTERRSMRLVLDGLKIDESKMPLEVKSFDLSEEDRNLSADEKFEKAKDIMFDYKYDEDKKTIMNPIDKFQKTMNIRLENELNQAVKSTFRAEVLQIILAFIIIFAIGILLKLFYSQCTNPINNYTELLHDINFKSKNFRLIPQGSYELRLLAETFNEIYISLQEELLKRKNAEKTMKVAKEEAELANKAKSEFLANMSHEIRTPLNAIIGYEYILKSTVLDVKQKEYSDKIGISAKNLLGIINSILDFSKIEADKLILESACFDLRSQLNDIFSIVYFEVENKGLKMNLNIDDDVPQYLKGDIIRLKQVILNLISNGIKFTEKGSIDLNIQLQNKNKNYSYLKFSISDTGIGITEKQKEFLFDAFAQGDASTTRKYGGTGLGLAISKRIVELMGGEIYIESEYGKGATFIFTVKFEMPEKVIVMEKTDSNENNSVVFNNKKILLVEDNEINMNMTKEILGNLGFGVDIAASGEASVEMVKKNGYHAVLMDIQMPNMDGYEAARIIRGMKDKQTLPIIALSADAVEGAEDKATESGMNSYITKPLNPKKLIEILKQYINFDSRSYSIKENKSNKNIVIDIEAGIGRLGENRNKYKEILEMFIKNHSDDGEKLSRYILNEELEKAKLLVHSIKGVAGNIEAIRLKNICEKLEEVILSKEVEKINLLVIEFQNEIKEVINCYINSSLALFTEDRVGDKDVKIKNDSSDLTRLIDLLQSGDSEAKVFFQYCKGYLKSILMDDEYIALNDNISLYNFEDALGIIKKITHETKDNIK